MAKGFLPSGHRARLHARRTPACATWSASVPCNMRPLPAMPARAGRSARVPPTATGCRNCPPASARCPTGPCSTWATRPRCRSTPGASRSSGLCEQPLVARPGASSSPCRRSDDESDFHCVTTWSRLDNHWRGVRFRTLAELAVPGADGALRDLHRLRPAARQRHPLHDQPRAGPRRRGRRAARAHLGGRSRCPASTAARAG